MKKVIANWTYTPKDYLEDETLVEESGYAINIKDGDVELVINEEDETNVSETHSKYSDLVESFFMNELLNKRQAYELKASTLKFVGEDGSISHFLKVKRANVSIEFATELSFKKLDKDGKVIYDSKEEKKKRQAELLIKLQNALHSDELVKGLFESYKNAITDPDNELVHLYEIRDALLNRFGSKAEALKILSIEGNDWSDLGRICNELPLKEGRHRGQMKGKLRNASKEELKLAREISLKMIESSIDYVNKK